MFSPLSRDGKFLGHSLRRDGRFYFFGSRHVSAADLPAMFPKYEFCFLKQVHGKIAVDANPEVKAEADAHFTSRKGLALVAYSADCVPILLSSPTQICTIHAGWRGCAQNIVRASAVNLRSAQFAAIGPHIQNSSFEIGDDALSLLTQAVPAGHGPFDTSIGGGKSLFDLQALTRAQLITAYGPNLTIATCLEDTKTDLNFHSFRRDRERAERQFSFVVIED